MAVPTLQEIFQGVITPEQVAAAEAQRQDMYLQRQAADPKNAWRWNLQQSLDQLRQDMQGDNAPEAVLRRTAIMNRATLSDATKQYGRRVAAGEDPERAQLGVLSDAIDRFSSQGNYDAISALAPTYLALQNKMAEIDKLKQEGAQAAANTQKSLAETVKANVEAQLAPVLAGNTLQNGASTRALNAAQSALDMRKVNEGESANVVDLTNPKGGTFTARIDPVTKAASYTDAQGQYHELKPGQYRTIPNNAAATKPMPPKVADEIKAAGASLKQTSDLLTGFQPGFGGYKVDGAGDVDLALKRNIFGDKTGATQWWQAYQQYQNVARHAIFGSALTDREYQEWKKAAVTPGMRDDQIQANLQRQADAARRAAAITSKGWAFNYDPAQIEAFLGQSIDDLDVPNAAAARAGNTSQQPSIDDLVNLYKNKKK